MMILCHSLSGECAVGSGSNARTLVKSQCKKKQNIRHGGLGPSLHESMHGTQHRLCSVRVKRWPSAENQDSATPKVQPPSDIADVLGSVHPRKQKRCDARLACPTTDGGKKKR